MKIYHNPRCQKSREALAMLEANGANTEIVLYMNDLLSPSEIQELLEKLNMRPIDLVRTKESDWKTEYEGKELTDEEIILAMAENPKLIERPIVVKGKKAVIGRPADNVLELL
jgi:arsenate reductase (glutaredoxin)